MDFSGLGAVVPVSEAGWVSDPLSVFPWVLVWGLGTSISFSFFFSFLSGSRIPSNASSVFFVVSFSTRFSMVRSAAFSAFSPSFFRNCPLAPWVRENTNKQHNIVLGRVLLNFINSVFIYFCFYGLLKIGKESEFCCLVVCIVHLTVLYAHFIDKLL